MISISLNILSMKSKELSALKGQCHEMDIFLKV
jgi:hypothetical protein